MNRREVEIVVRMLFLTIYIKQNSKRVLKYFAPMGSMQYGLGHDMLFS